MRLRRPACRAGLGTVAMVLSAGPLFQQLRRTLVAVGLNLGEGYGASGGGMRPAYRIALGEAAELEMGLEMAAALGYCVLAPEQRDSLQRIIATLRKLARPC